MTRKHQQNIVGEIIIIIFKTIWAVIRLPYYFWTKDSDDSGLGKTLLVDRALVAKQWQEIELLMKTAGPANFRHAVSEADKLFDYVLKGKVANENTFADRLKKVEKIMDKDAYNMVWRAHKIRNRLVHEAETEIMSWEARDAINGYKKGLMDLGALINE